MALKDDILSALEENRGSFVSGQTLAEKLGVSRAAVNKAVAALKESGCRIESATNRGYRLSADELSEAGVRAALPEKYRDIGVVVLRETDSTNNEAKRLLSAGRTGTFLVTAESQTGGRGRRGRSFASPSGEGAYLTLAVRADASITDAVSSTTRAATATALALEKLTGEKMSIKWVNDIYYKDKKICGILTEAVSDFESGVTQTLIIGIGVNMRSEGLPAELRDVAGALDREGLTRCEVIGAVAAKTLDLVADLADRSYLDAYRERSLVLGREVTFSGGGFESRSGLAVDIDGDGGLVVRLPDGTEKTLRSGEITLRVKREGP
ncbi:MAG: biotin--[Oscillospiraceae bacterium]|nr:biotin--[acetyl-CoA-carboxylase] ligase [Oscillospiraceae bacterium]